MGDIKTILNEVYGINDDNFVTFINKFNTFKKIIGLSLISHVPVESVREIYNKFLYYFSLGHTMDTIVNETISDIKRLFFLNGEGNLKYKISDNEKIFHYGTSVHIVDRVCHVKIYFKTKEEINANGVLIESIPCPTLPFNTIVETTEGYNILVVDVSGLKVYTKSLPANTIVHGSLMYIVDK